MPYKIAYNQCPKCTGVKCCRSNLCAKCAGAWNKGKKGTQYRDGNWINPRKGKPGRGYKHSEIARQKISVANIGNTHRKGKPHTLDSRQKISTKNYERWANNPATPEFRAKISTTVKKLWSNPAFRFKLQHSLVIKPTQPELYLDAILQLNFPHEWKYTGDWNFWIENKNPDFVNCNGKKLIIEFDGYYKHLTPQGIEKDAMRSKIYKKYGYTSLSLKMSDLKNEEDLIKKIRIFIENHTSISINDGLPSGVAVGLRRGEIPDTTVAEFGQPIS